LKGILPTRIGSAPSIVFHDVKGKNLQDSDSPSWYNQEEIAQVQLYLYLLYSHDLHPEDIGIITPYSKQVYFKYFYNMHQAFFVAWLINFC